MREDGSMMDERNDWDLLVAALCKQVDEWPLAKWVTMEELASCSPDIEFGDDDEKYAVAGADELFSPEEVDEAEVEVRDYVEEKGLFVERDFHRGISLREYVDATEELDFDEIDSFSLTYEPALILGGQSEARYDGETLEIAPMREAYADFEGCSVLMDAGRKERLQGLIEVAGVRSWARNYHPDGYLVLDGWGWSLTIRFKSGKVFASEGSNAWPEALGLFWEGLFDIVGLEVPSGGERPAWVCELVGESDSEG